MENLLYELLTRLAAIGEEHEEVYDTDVRERMREAVFSGFLKPTAGFSMPSEFQMYGKEGNQLVRDALERYISAASAKADEIGLDFRGRLAAFQNADVIGPDQTEYSEFFGYVPPDEYDDTGKAL